MMVMGAKMVLFIVIFAVLVILVCCCVKAGAKADRKMHEISQNKSDLEDVFGKNE